MTFLRWHFGATLVEPGRRDDGRDDWENHIKKVGSRLSASIHTSVKLPS
jgi:hypothetical protein